MICCVSPIAGEKIRRIDYVTWASRSFLFVIYTEAINDFAGHVCGSHHMAKSGVGTSSKYEVRVAQLIDSTKALQRIRI